MSHLPERNEKICLNCNAELHGRYCHNCGQENLEPKESFWHLITHFVYDVTHFDGKFFATLKLLLRKPGLLSKEYALGRRASYLNPIRMYIFTSAFFFIIFFTFIRSKKEADPNSARKAQTELLTQEKKLTDSLAKEKDSAHRKEIEKDLKDIRRAKRQLVNFGFVQFDVDEKDTAAAKKSVVIGDSNDNDPETVAQYDSIQKTLSADKRDGWLTRLYKHKKIAINAKYQNNEREFWTQLQEKFMHSIPQMMFVSLPLIAAILQLLYLRRRKQFYYVNHAIFVIHVYIAIYILILCTYLTGSFRLWTGWSIFNWFTFAIVLFMLYYVYKAMRNFYGQSRGKTIAKYLILFFLCLLVFLLLMVIFLLTSALQI